MKTFDEACEIILHKVKPEEIEDMSVPENMKIAEDKYKSVHDEIQTHFKTNIIVDGIANMFIPSEICILSVSSVECIKQALIVAFSHGLVIGMEMEKYE